jgi:hypothetical protein
MHELTRPTALARGDEGVLFTLLVEQADLAGLGHRRVDIDSLHQLSVLGARIECDTLQNKSFIE